MMRHLNFEICNPKGRLERLDMLASSDNIWLITVSFLLKTKNSKYWIYFRRTIMISLTYVLLSSFLNDLTIIFLTGFTGFIIWFWFDFFTEKLI